MNRNRFLLIGIIAIAAGAFVSYAAYHSLESRNGSRMQAGAQVVVAAVNIPLGAKIEEKDLKIVHLPEADVPPGSFRSTTKIVGRGAVLPIAAGDFVLRNKLAGESAGSGLPALIPPGMRAVSVRVNEVIGVAGFVQPGTRVDVMVTGTPVGGSQEQTMTVLRNVAVIASGQNLERNSNGTAQASPVITLLVSPDDAQRLALASSEGKIQLSLRNPLDTGQTEASATDEASVFGRIAAPVAPVTHAAHPHRVAHVAPPPDYSVEVYKGDKKDITKFETPN